MKRIFSHVVLFLILNETIITFLQASTKNILRTEKFKITHLLLNQLESSELPVKAVVRHLEKEDGTVTFIMEILPSTENKNFQESKELLLSRKLGFKTSFSHNTDITIVDLQDFERSRIIRNTKKRSRSEKKNSSYIEEKIGITLGKETILSYIPHTNVSASLEFRSPFSPLEAFRLIVSSYKQKSNLSLH